MNSLPENPSLKEINAYKKKLTWGESSTLYQMATSSASELDELLTHGFDSGYKSILNKNNWNLKKLDGSIDEFGRIDVKFKPRVVLRHIYNEMGYELHCYPYIDGEIALLPMIDSPHCPFIKWHPESMRRLFRVSSLPNFAIQTVQKGDEADFALIKHIYVRVQELLELLKVHFDVIEIRGYNIAEFFKEVNKKHRNPSL
ncbi:hypothetical protein [Thalassotalea atypica]|uniref:hypothetical protein n=1 Tax=Thalassotalea atypica TaxID=2054316 RepID=UPI0025746A55|nr:hypothetical protein [Thalassotalea atypica]